jgi:hypothetical protein
MLHNHIQQTIRGWQEDEGARPKGDLVELLRLAHQSFLGSERKPLTAVNAARAEVRRFFKTDARSLETSEHIDEARPTLELLEERLEE